MSGEDIALLMHLLLFAYWLGGDIGVFYSSGFAINKNLTREARQAAGKIMMNLDLIPRLCLSMMLTVGGILTHYYGIDHPLWQMVGIILLGPIWTCALIYIHFNEGTDLVKKMTTVDYYFRWIMVFTLLASVFYAFNYTDRLDADPWVGAKLIVFAGLIFCGIMIRKYIGGFIKGIHNIVNDTINEEDDIAMAESLSKARIFVLTIWFLLLVEVWIGVAKPGKLPVNQTASVIDQTIEFRIN
ncbi:MAG: hypothetical protein MK201_05390 [Gammaproteobacteria bacterium]|jgi:hypothetical protein|nr:hypothetical protein [Gammaproteobacteria bacterium]|tara:strand:+ start:5275 stop:6000 length:726 start_codon:yes stop_codon:yes gene_type:complete